MKEKNIYKELFRLVKKTGEKLVVINPETDEAVVVLKLSDYEKLKLGEDNQREYIENEEILNENQQNFSFWDNSENQHKSLDMTPNSGRIDSLEIQKPTENTETSEVSISREDEEVRSDEDAGGGYVFEPIESEEQNL